MRHPEAQVLATDRSARRLKGMGERVRVANVRLLEADAASLPEGEGAFDLILCDVPCSGTGTLARNPELKVRLGASEPSRQAVIQKRILSAAVKRLAPGGRVLYSTCSLEAEENEAVVAGVTGVREVSLEEAMAGLVESGRVKQAVGLREGRLRTLPGVEWQGDGFFAVLFERVG